MKIVENTMKLYRKIRKIADTINRDNLFLYASQSAFYIIIATIPFVMMLISLTGFILPVSREYLLSVANPLIPEIIKSPVEKIIAELYDSSFSVASVTALSTLWPASRDIAAVERGVRNVYHAPPRKSFITGVISSFFYTIIFILMICALLVLIVFGSYLIELLRIKSLLLLLIFGRTSAIKWLFTYGLMTVVFAFLYSAFSGRSLRFKCHFPGAIFTSAGWMIFSVLFSFYIENFASYSYIYGSLTAIVLMMLWVYFCMVIFLLGAEVNKIVMVKRHKNRKTIEFTRKK